MNTILAFAFGFAAVAAGSAPTAPRRSEAELVRERARLLEMQGGTVVRKGSFAGKVAIINTQSRLAVSNLASVARTFVEQTQCNFVVEKGAPGNPDALRKAANADVAIVVVDDADTPLLLLAPEDRWGVLNVARLVDDLPSQSAKRRFFDSRGRKELIRGLSMLCGGAASQFKGNLMNAATLREADCMDERLPIDMVANYRRHLKACGVTQREETTYLDACLEGWASAPTNDVQKAVWDKVRAMPTDPIKIKFDPKVDK